MAQGITLGLAAVVCDLFITSSEGNRLEAQEADGFGIIESELNDAPDLLVVDAVDDGCYRNNVNPGVMQVVDGAQLYIKQVADLAMRVGGIAYAIELQISVAQAGFR